MSGLEVHIVHHDIPNGLHCDPSLGLPDRMLNAGHKTRMYNGTPNPKPELNPKL